MKKFITTSVLFVAFAVAAMAQTQSDLFKMTTEADADVVLKVLSTELKLSTEEFSKVREILVKSAQSQAQSLQDKNLNTPEMQVNVLRRQTLHIETNLKTILGEEKFKAYEAAKTKLTEQVKGNRKN
ncbi:MAG: hypothetical protein KIS94_06245 [Chitinophagales bacterium]|nr:hypothetical protein [Chitinophagales bacterium]